MTTEQVAHPETARSLWVLGDQVRMMGDLAEDRLGVVDVTVQPGAGTPPHRHASPEIFLVTEGAVTFGIFGEGAPRWIHAEPGAVVSIPSWLGHNYSNRSAEAARFTAIVHPLLRGCRLTRPAASRPSFERDDRYADGRLRASPDRSSDGAVRAT